MKEIIILSGIFLMLGCPVFSQSQVDSLNVKKYGKNMTSIDIDFLSGTFSYARRVSNRWFLGGGVGLLTSFNYLLTDRNRIDGAMREYLINFNLFGRYSSMHFQLDFGFRATILEFVAFGDEWSGEFIGMYSTIMYLPINPNVRLGSRVVIGKLIHTISELDGTTQSYITPIILRYTFHKKINKI